MFGANPRRRLRKRATSCISESTIRPESFPVSFPLHTTASRIIPTDTRATFASLMNSSMLA
uniref:Uncharacterized protein n=1 Tax=Arundo donax TaxID=35708 RepID=A0A0A9ILA3_ARUDO